MNNPLPLELLDTVVSSQSPRVVFRLIQCQEPNRFLNDICREGPSSTSPLADLMTVFFM